jgi:alpha-D-xyloside xylohydrolase
MPLFVRAGSILPLGPEIEYADQNVDGPIELRIYTGADGSFELFGDEGDNYNYEKGAHSVVPLKWSEAEKTFTIGDRVGSYAGLPKQLTFNIVWVTPNHGIGGIVEERPDRTVLYSGTSIVVRKE